MGDFAVSLLGQPRKDMLDFILSPTNPDVLDAFLWSGAGKTTRHSPGRGWQRYDPNEFRVDFSEWKDAHLNPPSRQKVFDPLETICSELRCECIITHICVSEGTDPSVVCFVLRLIGQACVEMTPETIRHQIAKMFEST